MDGATLKYIGSNGRPALYSAYLAPNRKAPALIFTHGYKGFKDWGAWNAMGQYFAQQGIHCFLMNTSHNGIGLDQPEDFTDLEAFGQNTYTKEITDLKLFIDFIKQEYQLPAIHLMGHSRGGFVSAQVYSQRTDISSCILLAPVFNIGPRFGNQEELERWKAEGVKYIVNGRTGQKMPHYYSFFEDYLKHQKTLEWQHLHPTSFNNTHVYHGTKDEAVSPDEGKHFTKYGAQLHLIENTGHTFHTKHPFTGAINGIFKTIVKDICDTIL